MNNSSWYLWRSQYTSGIVLSIFHELTHLILTCTLWDYLIIIAILEISKWRHRELSRTRPSGSTMVTWDFNQDIWASESMLFIIAFHFPHHNTSFPPRGASLEALSPVGGTTRERSIGPTSHRKCLYLNLGLDGVRTDSILSLIFSSLFCLHYSHKRFWVDRKPKMEREFS